MVHVAHDCHHGRPRHSVRIRICHPTEGGSLDLFVGDVISESETEHEADLRDVLSQLRIHDLYAKLSECDFDFQE